MRDAGLPGPWLPRRDGLHRSRRLGPELVGGPGDGVELGPRGPRHAAARPGRNGRHRPARRERLRRRQLRDHGPVRQRRRPGRPRAPDRLPDQHASGRRRCRPSCRSSSATPARRAGSTPRPTTPAAPNASWGPGSSPSASPGVRSLRDVDEPMLERNRDRLPEVVARRCEHVVNENERVMDTVVGPPRRRPRGPRAAVRRVARVAARPLRGQLARARRHGRDRGRGARRRGEPDDRRRLRRLHRQPGRARRRGSAPRGRAGPSIRARTGLEPHVYVVNAVDGAGEVELEA